MREIRQTRQTIGKKAYNRRRQNVRPMSDSRQTGRKKEKKMELRPYQQDLYDDIRTQLANRKKSVCAVLGCGGGKSCIEASIAKSATDKGSRVLFLVHRAELCEQIARTFETWGVNPLLCDIMMVQTATRRIDRLKPPKLIITDEAHHCRR